MRANREQGEHGTENASSCSGPNGDGRILEGRHRTLACDQLGIAPTEVLWTGVPGTEVDYVLSVNLKRRHLNESQRALVAARAREVMLRPGRSEVRHLSFSLAPEGPASSTDIEPSRSVGRTSARVAQELNVSPRLVEYAAKVMREGVPSLVDAVQRGEVSIRAASTILELPVAEQLIIVACGERAVVEAARAILNKRRAASREALHSSNTVEHYTPAWIVDGAREVMGSIDLDPASCARANEIVKAEAWFGLDDGVAHDGIAELWWGNVFNNPPYGWTDTWESCQGIWTTKARDEYAAGRVTQFFLVVNAVPDRKWFAPLWDFALCFPYERVCFLDATTLEPQKQPTHPSVFVYAGPHVERFEARFRTFGRIVLPVRSLPAGSARSEAR